MFALCLLLFLAGLALFGVAFMVPAFNALVFVAGILLVSLAFGLPMHLKAR